MLGKSIVVALTPASSNSSQLSSTSSPFDMAFKFQFYAHTLSKCSEVRNGRLSSYAVFVELPSVH